MCIRDSMWSLGAVLELDDRKKVCVDSVFVVYFFNYIDNSFFDLRLFTIDWFNFVSLSGAKMFLSNVFVKCFHQFLYIRLSIINLSDFLNCTRSFNTVFLLFHWKFPLR